MPFVNFKVPEAALNRAQKEEIVHRATAMLVEYFPRPLGRIPWS